jgi:hypothetical protein
VFLLSRNLWLLKLSQQSTILICSTVVSMSSWGPEATHLCSASYSNTRKLRNACGQLPVDGTCHSTHLQHEEPCKEVLDTRSNAEIHYCLIYNSLQILLASTDAVCCSDKRRQLWHM